MGFPMTVRRVIERNRLNDESCGLHDYASLRSDVERLAADTDCITFRALRALIESLPIVDDFGETDCLDRAAVLAVFEAWEAHMPT